MTNETKTLQDVAVIVTVDGDEVALLSWLDRATDQGPCLGRDDFVTAVGKTLRDCIDSQLYPDDDKDYRLTKEQYEMVLELLTEFPNGSGDYGRARQNIEAVLSEARQ